MTFSLFGALVFIAATVFAAPSRAEGIGNVLAAWVIKALVAAADDQRLQDDVRAAEEWRKTHGDMFSFCRNHPECLARWEAGVMRGSTTAAIFYGRCYEELSKHIQGAVLVDDDERVCAIRWKKAFEWYGAAYCRGDMAALLPLARCAAFGRGTEQNAEVAFKLVREAADRGNPQAIATLAAYYANGIGVPKDAAKAAVLFQKAIDAGEDRALVGLGMCYFHGRGVDRNVRKAIALFRQAEACHDPDGIVGLGQCCLNGDGVEQDTAKAAQLFEKARSLGSSLGAFNLGVCYQEGLGVAKDADRAFHLFLQAAEFGVAPAMTKLAECYLRESADTRWDPLMPPVREDDPQPICNDPPSDEECLQLLLHHWPRVHRGIPYHFEESRDDITIVKERLVDHVYPPQFFPLVGLAHPHHCHWECKIYCTEIIHIDYPFAFSRRQPHVYVVYIDKDHMLLASAGAAAKRIRAVKWLRTAAGLSEPKAMVGLGECYEKGWGVERDAAKAIEWYRKSAALGEPTAMTHLGTCCDETDNAELTGSRK